METITRTPPQNDEAERAVLASCILDQRYALAGVANLLTPADFYRRANGVIFATIQELARTGAPVDLITLGSALGNRLGEVGGNGYLVDLVGGIPTTAHANYYAGLVKDAARRRAYIEVCATALHELYDADAPDASLRLTNRVLELQATGARVQRASTLPDVVAAEHQRMINLVDRRVAGDDTETRAFTTGIPSLDQLLAIDEGDMVVLGARPSAGKTALGLQIAAYVAEVLGKRTRFFSLEMSKEALARRWLTSATAISAGRQLNGYIDPGGMIAIAEAEQHARDWLDLLEIDDRSGLTVAQIHASYVQGLQERPEPIGLVVIDHMVKVRSSLPGNATGHAKMTQVCNDVKQFAKDTKVPVLALMQLSRPMKGSESKEPRMSDLRESGTIEEDADVIIMLHRPERGGSVSEAIALVEKNRNGPVGRVHLCFDAQRTTFRGMPGPGAL